MEEQKNNNSKIIIIILAILGGLLLLGVIAICVVFLFSGVLYKSIQKNINNQWNEMIEEQKNNFDEPKMEKDSPKTESTNEVKLDKTIDGKTVVYLFRGQGCPHCTEAEKWLESIKEDYGKMFMVKDYEVWYDEDNEEFMNEVADERGEEVNGVPYIIIGDKSWKGFTSSYENEMLSEIKRVYELY